MKLFSLLHRANFVNISPHPGRFLHFFLLSLSLSGSLRACFLYIRSVDEERRIRRAKLVFSFSSFCFLVGRSLRSLVRSKSCALVSRHGTQSFVLDPTTGTPALSSSSAQFDFRMLNAKSREERLNLELGLCELLLGSTVLSRD